MVAHGDVGIREAVRTPQFWMLWTNLCCNVTAGIGVLGVAKTMVGDIFGARWGLWAARAGLAARAPAQMK